MDVYRLHPLYRVVACVTLPKVVELDFIFNFKVFFNASGDLLTIQVSPLGRKGKSEKQPQETIPIFLCPAFSPGTTFNACTQVTLPFIFSSIPQAFA